MKIAITKIINPENHESSVNFSSQYGSAVGLWKGDLPKVNNEYFVEIDIPNIMLWGKDIKLSKNREYKIESINNRVSINAEIESIEEDNCLTLRIGESIILVETCGDPISGADYIILSIDEISLYPYL